jgi:hypothetical protein
VNLFGFVENAPVGNWDSLGLIRAGCFGSCMVACMVGFDAPPPCEWGPPPFASLGAGLLAMFEIATGDCPKGPAGSACRKARREAQKFLTRMVIKLGIKGGLKAVPFIGWGLVAIDLVSCGVKCSEACNAGTGGGG